VRATELVFMGTVDEFLARATEAKEHGHGRVLSLDALAAKRDPDTTKPTLSFATMRGRLVEISARGASAALTCAMELVVDAQRAGDPACWITFGTATFYPPDAEVGGIDLEALVIVRVTDLSAATHAADRVLRCGAFGLVVIDLGAEAELSLSQQGRLVTLAQAHDAAVVCLTDKATESGSLGSLISLRVEALRNAESTVELRALKDKRRGPNWTDRRSARKPNGY